ncbi:MAG: penicillin-binding protein 2 [Elusimicrobia bacterium]|nr:penicillin-binding protein 2 [Elusimicrobiota bacterium]
MIASEALVHSKLSFLWKICVAFTLIFSARLFYLQVVRSRHYHLAAEGNRTQLLFRNAPRGRIWDLQKTLLAGNKPSFSFYFLPGSEEDRDYLERFSRKLEPYLGFSRSEVLKDLQESYQKRSPMKLAESLSGANMFRLAELRPLYPGMELVLEAQRDYPYGAHASHVLGYIAEMDPAGWSRYRHEGYRLQERVGKMGVERIYEKDLRGRVGGIRVEVDSRGRLQGILESVSWERGNDIHLWINHRLQEVAEEALRRSPSGVGAVVGIRPSDGAVLILASIPDFDPNAYLLPPRHQARQRLLQATEFNRAVQGTYAPASTFKLITLAAALEEGVVDPENSTLHCPGYFRLGRRVAACWKKEGHGKIDLLRAVAQSCDVYFYQLGLRVGGERLAAYARRFRLGMRTYAGFSGEAQGFVPSPGERAASGQSWYEGDTLNMAIGQGELLTTPLQMALVVSAIAARGQMFRPRAVDAVRGADGRVLLQTQPELLARVRFSEATWDILQQGMALAVREGTAQGAQWRGLEVSGKTGTAENPLGKDHAWFLAFVGLPEGPPGLALSVLVEHGGMGAAAAVPVARQVIAAFAEGLHSEREEWSETLSN